MLREVLTSLAVVGHFSFPLFAHCCCLQVILHGLFWLIWANCTILLHLFDYSSIFDMPAVPLLYVLLTPVLVASTLVCYFYPLRVMSVWDSCFSHGRGTDRTRSKEQEPLLQAETVVHGESLFSTAEASDTHLSPQGMDARS